MDLIIVHQRMKLSNLFLRTMSNFLLNTNIGSARCICYANTRFQNFTRIGSFRNSGVRFINPQTFINYSFVHPKVFNYAFYEFNATKTIRSFCSQSTNKELQKPTLFQKMKQMSKDYWHILFPVHIVCSIGWISVCYIAIKNGVDVVSILQRLHLPEYCLEKVRNSSAGNWAVAYALFKVCSPLRYTTTLGVTTLSIRYLNKWGIIKLKKPEKMKDMTVPLCKPSSPQSDVKSKTTAGSQKT